MTPQPVPGFRLDLRVLLLAGPDGDPTTAAWRDVLRRTGVPHVEVPHAAHRFLTAGDLLRRPGHGRYNAVVLGGGTPEPGAVTRYRRLGGVRALRAYGYPGPADGLTPAPWRAVGGTGVHVTAAGRGTFPDLRGELTLAGGCSGHLGRLVDPARLTPLLRTADGSPVAGLVHRPDGLEDVLVLVDTAPGALHGLLTARGLLAWVTRGCHLGLSRNFLAVHVDDVFLANRTAGATDRGAAGGEVRMGPADVAATLAWQERTGFRLDLAFNGAGAAPGDPLTAALLEHRAAFRWVNHTWSHRDLDGAGPEVLREEIRRNTAFAREHGIAAPAGALVTGAHTGLRNPALPAALRATGVGALAADSSTPPAGAVLGPATVVPRHPTNVYTDAVTWERQLDAYNRRYSGEGILAPDARRFLDAECTIVLRHVLSGDPAPTFAHQSNLTGDRVLLDLAAHVLARHSRAVSPEVPLLSPSMDSAAAELRRRDRWCAACGGGHVDAVREGDALRVATAVDVEVPLTVPLGSRTGGEAFGEPYAGSASAWRALAAGQTLRIALPAGAPA
ncbi:hypothetical protein NUM3379_41470 [Kineococcus sp. NUM-3379]